MSDLEWLVANCVSVHASFNVHKDYYQTAESVFKEDDLEKPERRRLDGIDPAVRAECIEKNTLLELHIYPDTPVGFCLFHHWDLGELCRIARQHIEGQRS